MNFKKRKIPEFINVIAGFWGRGVNKTKHISPTTMIKNKDSNDHN